jgi:CRP-like cAMP-binding protein
MQAISLHKHPDRMVIHAELKQNSLLQNITDDQLAELENHLQIVDVAKGGYLLTQGDRDMEQYFILDGLLKRVVSNAKGNKEMVLRFASERGMETSYAAWRLKTPAPYSIIASTKCRVAKLNMPAWVAFLENHADFKAIFEYEVMGLMGDIMAHTITLHLLNAPGRVHRFERKHPELFERIPKKELAAYLNLSAETLSRLKQRGKI